jgi:hypothetical protein
MPPMSFNLLRFIARRIESFYNFWNRIRQQVVRNITTIVKLEWEKYLEPPPPLS